MRWGALGLRPPRVQLHLDFRNPVGIDDAPTIEGWAAQVSCTSVRFESAVWRPDGERAAKGYLAVVALDDQLGMPEAVPWALVFG